MRGNRGGKEAKLSFPYGAVRITTAGDERPWPRLRRLAQILLRRDGGLAPAPRLRKECAAIPGTESQEGSREGGEGWEPVLFARPRPGAAPAPRTSSAVIHEEQIGQDESAMGAGAGEGMTQASNQNTGDECLGASSRKDQELYLLP